MRIGPSHLRDSAVLNGLNHFYHENDQCRLRQELHLDGRYSCFLLILPLTYLELSVRERLL